MAKVIYSKQYWKDIESVIENIPNLKKIEGKSVLVTGATGMICSAVVEILLYLQKKGLHISLYLAGRNEERMRVRFEKFVEGVDYIFVQYDATEEIKFNIEPDYIIHGASNANPTIYSQKPVETMLGNIVGIKNLLQLAEKKENSRILYISSSEVYGNLDIKRSYKEEDYGYFDILNPRACYPSAKRAAETLCASYWNEYGVESIIVRPGHIYGPTITKNDSRASAQFTRCAVRNKDIIMKSMGLQMRSYCYSLDCATAIIAALLNGKTGNAYNISNKSSIVSIREIAEAFANYSGVRVVFECPSELEKKGYNMMLNSSLDATKLEKLGWKAKFDLKTGVAKTVEYMKINMQQNI